MKLRKAPEGADRYEFEVDGVRVHADPPLMRSIIESGDSKAKISRDEVRMGTDRFVTRHELEETMAALKAALRKDMADLGDEIDRRGK